MSDQSADREDGLTGLPSISASIAGAGIILVSACLLGVPCRYDGGSNLLPQLRDLVARGRVLPVCPEVAGGLSTPRLPAEIQEAHLGLDGLDVLEEKTRVVRADGMDVTAQFVEGAQIALALARSLDIHLAILKADSPSCGPGRIHDGRFEGNLVAGDGVTAALLKRAGVEVLTEEDTRFMSGEGDEQNYRVRAQF